MDYDECVRNMELRSIDVSERFSVVMRQAELRLSIVLEMEQGRTSQGDFEKILEAYRTAVEAIAFMEAYHSATGTDIDTDPHYKVITKTCEGLESGIVHLLMNRPSRKSG